jgi:hypothetical protein
MNLKTIEKGTIAAAEPHCTDSVKKIGKTCILWAIGLTIAVEAISLIEPFTGNITPPVVAACLPTKESVNGRTVFKCDNRPSKCRRGGIVRINGKTYRKLICRR